MMSNKLLMFLIAAAIPQTFCGIPGDLFKIELQIPTFLRALVNNLIESKKLMRTNTIHLDWDNTNNDNDNFLVRITTKGFPMSRRDVMQRQPGVEIGPGAFKTEIVTYPPNFLANRLKYLMKIKEKQAT